MKLFKPVILWSDTGAERALTIGILGSNNFKLEMRTTPDNVAYKITPDVPEDSDPIPELVFIAGVHSVLRSPTMAFLSSKSDEYVRKLAISGMHRVMTELVRSIENTPRGAEYGLELAYVCYGAGVPPTVGGMLFADEIRASLVEQTSDFEKSMAEKAEGLSPTEMHELVLREMPPPTYQFMVPEVPADMLAELDAEIEQRRQLAATPPAGSA